MKIRQAVLPIALLGLLFSVVACNNASTSTPSAQQQVEQVEVGPGVEQVVIFYSTGSDAILQLQNDVNAWLIWNHGKAEIVRVLQSQNGREVRMTTISIFYKKIG